MPRRAVFESTRARISDLTATMKELSKWLLQIQEVQTPISGHMTELTLERHFDEILPADSKLRKITMLSV